MLTNTGKLKVNMKVRYLNLKEKLRKSTHWISTSKIKLVSVPF